MPTYRAEIEYEGTRYSGWQLQTNARSIAGELQRACRSAGLDVVEIAGAGRTDAGVHALSQTAHLRLGGHPDPRRAQDEINRALPHDIHVLTLRRAGDAFHARHDAIARSYVYQIATRRTALAKRFVWWVRAPLNFQRMTATAVAVEGLHDFRHFCERPAEQTDTRAAVERIELAREGDLLLIRFVASHFLWKMVRRLVGTLVKVGSGALDPVAVAELLAPGTVTSDWPVAAWTAPPSGLFLERVIYAGEPPPGPLTAPVPVGSPWRRGKE